MSALSFSENDGNLSIFLQMVPKVKMFQRAAKAKLSVLVFEIVTKLRFHHYFLGADGGKGEEDCKKGAEGAQPSSQEGRGRQSYPRHETQASLLWKTRFRKD